LRQLFRYLVLATTLMGSGAAWAATLTGTVTNGTSNKPAAGDEIVLLILSNDGMNESARVKTDGAGRFVFKVPDSAGSRVVRVIHQGVTYHSIVPADGTRVNVRVYDTAEKVEGISAVMDVQRFEATDETLEIKQLVTMRNDSKPPRTLMNDRPFEIQLPPDAQVQSGLMQFEDGQPLKQRPLTGDQKGQYYFVFPVRPGDTRFAVVYRLPYKGEAVIAPTIRNPYERFVVMLPKSIKFEPKAAGIFQPMPDTTPGSPRTRRRARSRGGSAPRHARAQCCGAGSRAPEAAPTPQRPRRPRPQLSPGGAAASRPPWVSPTRGP